MLNNLKWAGWLLSAVLIIILLIQRGCVEKVSESSSVSIPTVEKIDTVYTDTGKTILKPIMIPGKIITRDGKMIQLPPTHNDTLAILKNCAAERVYIDTLKSKSGKIKGILTDTIQNNKRKSLTLKGSLTDTVHIQKNQFKVFIGFTAGVNLHLNSASLGPQFIFLTKNDQLYSVGYDILSGTPYIGMSWKIHFGK